MTQRACGSLTNLLKIRGPGEEGAPADGEETAGEASAENPAPEEGQTEQEVESKPTGSKPTNDIQQKMSSQLGALDSLLTKAENASYSMQQQNKQMKNLLK